MASARNAATGLKSTSAVQAQVYDQVTDYSYGSPHLAHRRLNAWLRGLILDAVMGAGPSPRVLDVGAGHGSFTEMLLAAGCEVVATEVSAGSVEELGRRFGKNPNFRAMHDPQGALALPASESFTAILFASVLHHIPDYLTATDDAVRRFLRPGGSLITVQDPLWYPTVPPTTKMLSNVLYYAWRITQGDFRRGLKTRMRRMRGVYDPAEPSDVVEYHVVRKGVDQMALTTSMQKLFREVTLVPYWSAQSSLGQDLGKRLGRKNTFAIICRDYRPAHAAQDR